MVAELERIPILLQAIYKNVQVLIEKLVVL